MNPLAARVHALIRNELATAPERLVPDARLAELGDSLDWLSLLAAVEAEFDIEIGEAQERGLVTVADLIRLLEAQPALAAT